MSTDLLLLGNLSGIIAAIAVAWKLGIDVWKGAALGAALVGIPLLIGLNWPDAENAAVAAGVIGFVAAASAMKVSARKATIIFATSLASIVFIALLLTSE